MISFPHPKINIGLYITNRRADGFHDLETIFYPVENKKDTLEIELLERGVTAVMTTPSTLQIEPEENLCFRAYSLLKKKFLLPEVKITLTKEIPIGAGLGGGSADAAFTLKMLNEMFALGLSKAELKEYAIALGSDVPFFIENRPVFATGRGEIMEPISLDLSHKVITIVKPDIFISTKEAYANVTPKPASFDLRKIDQLPIQEWRAVIKNDFEETIFKKHPLLQAIKEELYRKGADYSSLSGSGSALYAIADHEIEIDDLK